MANVLEYASPLRQNPHLQSLDRYRSLQSSQSVQFILYILYSLYSVQTYKYSYSVVIFVNSLNFTGYSDMKSDTNAAIFCCLVMLLVLPNPEKQS